jgi:hypothetical protein
MHAFLLCLLILPRAKPIERTNIHHQFARYTHENDEQWRGSKNVRREILHPSWSVRKHCRMKCVQTHGKIRIETGSTTEHDEHYVEHRANSISSVTCLKKRMNEYHYYKIKKQADHIACEYFASEVEELRAL